MSNVMCVCDIDVFALICCCGGVCGGVVCFRLSCSRLSRRSCLSCCLRRLCGVTVIVEVVGVFGGVGVGGAAIDEVMNILNLARDVPVETHLRNLYYLADRRGSDVRVESGENLDTAAQAVPYPAPIWDWNTVSWSCPVFFVFAPG